MVEPLAKFLLAFQEDAHLVGRSFSGDAVGAVLGPDPLAGGRHQAVLLNSINVC